MLGLGLRGRLFLSIVVLVGVFALTSGWWLSGQLRTELVEDVEDRLGAHARTLARVMPQGADIGTIRAAAMDFEETTGGRVTVIATDGKVLADTSADVAEMDDHRSRPEVVAALTDGYGVSSRYSSTIRQQMLYVAVPWPADDPVGVVRVAMPLNDVEARVGRVLNAQLLAGFVGLLLTLLGAALLTDRFTRDLRELTLRARGLSRDGSGPPRDEIAWISGSIDRLSDELHRAVDEVADERNRLQAVLSGMLEAVVAVDSKGVVQLTNPAAQALLQVDGSAIGRPLVEAVGSPALLELVARVLDAEAAEMVDVIWTASGSRADDLSLMVTATPQVGGGAVLVAHDVTELRRLEAVRRDFVANVSHELRTPVAVIQSSAEALIAGAAADPTHGPRFLDAIHRHAERLGALITDLLDLARIERGNQALDLGAVDLLALVEDALDPLESRAAARGQRLEIAVPDDLRVKADKVALRQVVSNLVDNAVKYTPDGSRIRVTAEVVGPDVRLVVADDGPGIPKIHHDRIFERFYRIDPGRSPDMGGTGLGLSIVRHLLDIQGATVRIEDNVPRGARFVVALPLA